MTAWREGAGWFLAAAASAALLAGAAMAALRGIDSPGSATGPRAIALDLSLGTMAAAPAPPTAELRPRSADPATAAASAAAPPGLPPVAQTVPEPTTVSDPPQPPAPDTSPPKMMSPAPPGPRPLLPSASLPDGLPELPPPVLPPALADPPAPEPSALRTSPRPMPRPAQKAHPEPPPEQLRKPDHPAPPARPAPIATQDSRTPEPAASKPDNSAAPGTEQAARPAERRQAGGAQATARYADQVLRKVTRQGRPQSPERGSVTVGFEIAPDGRLAAVRVLRTSGSATLDTLAADHVRRAAPFPPPPQGDAMRFSFEFVAR